MVNAECSTIDIYSPIDHSPFTIPIIGTVIRIHLNSNSRLREKIFKIL